jgi:type IV secretory pathway TraG/TraD family ATPase VirD4
MKDVHYYLAVFFSRLAAWFSLHTYLHTARWAFLHELAKIALPKDFLSKKMSGILLAVGKFDRLLCVLPTKKQQELTNVILIGDTRSGKGLNIGTNLLWWPFPLVMNDLKEEGWRLAAGFRENGLGGKAVKFDPRGNGAKYDPLAGMKTDADFRSAATILLHRPQEGENAIFTERAITMLVQIFTAAWLEGYRALPFTYFVLNEGLAGVAKILQQMTQKHQYYPNLATKFLDMTYEKAVRDDFSGRFLNDCYSTMTTRMNNILTKESVRCFMGSDFTPKDIITSGEHPISVFLCWPEKDLLALSPLIELVWDSLINGMVAAYDEVRGAGCSRTLLILDEIFRTGMKKLPDYSTTICGRNMSILLTAQSLSQLFEAYGSFKAKILLGQMKSAVVHAPSPLDNDGAKFIEEALYYTSGFAHSTNEHAGGSSQGASEQRVPLLTADEIKLLGEEQVLGFRKGLRPTIAKRFDWREFPDLVSRANLKPPEVPELHPLDTSEMDIGHDRLAPVSSWRDDPTLLRHRNDAPAFLEAENPTSADRKGWN